MYAPFLCHKNHVLVQQKETTECFKITQSIIRVLMRFSARCCLTPRYPYYLLTSMPKCSAQQELQNTKGKIKRNWLTYVASLLSSSDLLLRISCQRDRVGRKAKMLQKTRVINVSDTDWIGWWDGAGCNFSIKGPDNRRRHHRVVRAGKRLSELLCEQHIIRHSLQSVLCSRCFSSEYQFRAGNGQGNELLMRALAIKQQ